MRKTILQQHYSCSVQKTPWKNTKYSRNARSLKIGHHAKAIAHAKAKWSVWVKSLKCQKHAKNDSTMRFFLVLSLFLRNSFSRFFFRCGCRERFFFSFGFPTSGDYGSRLGRDSFWSANHSSHLVESWLPFYNFGWSQEVHVMSLLTLALVEARIIVLSLSSAEGVLRIWYRMWPCFTCFSQDFESSPVLVEAMCTVSILAR